jgi:hypothetical protein
MASAAERKAAILMRRLPVPRRQEGLAGELNVLRTYSALQQSPVSQPWFGLLETGVAFADG